MDVALELVIGAEHALLAEDSLVVGFLNGAFEDVDLAVVFAANEDVGDVALGGEAGDGDAFEHLVGVVVDEVAVFESAGLGFVGIDGHVVRAFFFLGDEGPFLAGGEARAAAAAQAGFGDGFDDFVGLHVERFFKRLISAGGDVVVVPEESAFGDVVGDAFEEDGFGEGHGNAQLLVAGC